jgi:GT2 family glycosyltransferase
MVPKRIFDVVGGFDSDYFMYYEDVDLSWRIRLRGYMVALAPHSIVYHEGGPTAKSNNAQRKVLGSLYSGRNYFTTLVKNLELHNLIVYGTLHLAVHVGTVAYYLLKGRSYEALGLLFALALTVRELPISWRKRLGVQNLRLVSDREIFSKADVQLVPQYFRQAFARSIPQFFTHPQSNS